MSQALYSPQQILSALDYAYKRCSDCMLHEHYTALLEYLLNYPLTDEIVAFLCDRSVTNKQFWACRLSSLRVLLLNESAKSFNLKDFYAQNLSKSRRLATKLFFIRGYALYAAEAEMIPVMKKFAASMKKHHDPDDYAALLSAAGLPYLVKTYGYDCCAEALHIAQEEYEQINPLLRGHYTYDESINCIHLLSDAEIKLRYNAYLGK